MERIDYKQNTTSKPKLKKVASNSVLLFIRVLALAMINLYAVRLMVNSLGNNDYGLYNALAGVVTLSVILITLFALPIQRFFSFYIGKGDFNNIKIVFSASLNMIVLLCIIILIVFETAGVYFVQYEMIIPIERMNAAMATFQIAIITFLFSLLQVPFLAMVLANENMGIYALISCVDSLLKLVSAYLIAFAPIDKLIFYSICLFIVASTTFIMYVTICITKYKECRYCMVKDKNTYVGILKFIGWTSLGSFSGVGLVQGSIILLNIFFGPLANAAFGIANNIYNALMSLGNSTIVAFRPATIKSYAANDIDSLNKLFCIGNKFLIYLLLAIVIPLFTEMKEILTLWLGNSNELTVLFCRLFIIYGIVICLGTPISNIVQASGRLKVYYLSCELIIFLHLPLAYAMFYINLPSYYIFISMISVCTLSHIIRVALLKRYYANFSQHWYYISFLTPAVLVAVMSGAIAQLLHSNIEDMLIRTSLVIFIMPIITIMLAGAISLSQQERAYAKDFINRKIKR